MMKKRILALLLAGLITASLASCVTTQERPGGSQNGGTEATQNPGEQNTNPPPAPTTWSDANDTVYVIAAMTLTAVDNQAETTTVRVMDKLQRTKIGSNNQSIVLKDGKAYYAASKNLTNEDLLGENFTTLDTAQTMYIKEQNVNVRTYASSNNSYSPSITQLSFNDTVKVVAAGSKWSKIEYVKDGKTNYYFVFSKYLSPEKAIDPNDKANYPELQSFSQYADPKTMYVIVSKEGGSLAIRTCPSVESTAKAYLVREDQVSVIAKGTVGASEWCEIVYAYTDDEAEGTGIKTISGYVNAKYLSETKTGVALVTLDDMIKQYPAFATLAQPQTMYATGKLFVRSSPEITEKLEDNYVTELQKADAVKVVATGKQNDILWAIVESEDGEYFFTSYHYLTTDPAGEVAPMTLDQIIAAYPNFTPCDGKTYYAKSVVNCNKIPEYQDEDEITKKLKTGDAVTVVATGKVDYIIDWYVFRADDGNLYFAGADLFSETPIA